MNRILNLILAHQPAAELEKLLRWWSLCAATADILVAYGGTLENFKTLPEIPRVFIDDSRLRVKDLQRQKQSYGAIWRSAAGYLAEPLQQDFTHVYFAEYDHLPLVPDLAARLLARLETERADILAHHLRRIDGTSNDFYLYHISDPAFAAFWEKNSVRADKKTVLQMHGSASFWTREAFLKVAAQPESISAYLEIYLPTLAHHLGFRIRDFREQNEFVLHASSRALSMAAARQKGSWTVHPVKAMPL
jgi:hypothetical protein